MEAFFYFWQQFFSAPAQSPGRDAQQPPQLPGHIGPELPQRPQRRRRQQQIQSHARPGAQQIDAFVPLAEMFGYATDLRSRTQGRGQYTMEPSHYIELPKGLQEKLINKRTGRENF